MKAHLKRQDEGKSAHVPCCPCTVHFALCNTFAQILQVEEHMELEEAHEDTFEETG